MPLECTLGSGQIVSIELGYKSRAFGEKRLQGLAAPELSETGGHVATAALIQIVKGRG